MGAEKNGMGKYIEQARPRLRTSTYQKFLKDYQKVKNTSSTVDRRRKTPDTFHIHVIEHERK